VLLAHDLRLIHIVLLENLNRLSRGSGFATRENGFAGLTAPVGVALLLVSFLGGTEPASPPYGTQRVDFAVLWNQAVS